MILNFRKKFHYYYLFIILNVNTKNLHINDRRYPLSMTNNKNLSINHVYQ